LLLPVSIFIYRDPRAGAVGPVKSLI
jgi:hypothetical protein